ncbi:HECT-domain-containing protein [Mycena kentingensis (nom. inval.)]|nr:HECT-domain-containing protein [Mycena kentingensis (nom. inval.)]
MSFRWCNPMVKSAISQHIAGPAAFQRLVPALIHALIAPDFHPLVLPHPRKPITSPPVGSREWCVANPLRSRRLECSTQTPFPISAPICLHQFPTFPDRPARQSRRVPAAASALVACTPLLRRSTTPSRLGRRFASPSIGGLFTCLQTLGSATYLNAFASSLAGRAQTSSSSGVRRAKASTILQEFTHPSSEKSPISAVLFHADLYHHVLLTIGDDELFGMSTAAARNLLSLDELTVFSRLLLDVAFELYQDIRNRDDESYDMGHGSGRYQITLRRDQISEDEFDRLNDVFKGMIGITFNDQFREEGEAGIDGGGSSSRRCARRCSIWTAGFGWRTRRTSSIRTRMRMRSRHIVSTGVAPDSG